MCGARTGIMRSTCDVSTGLRIFKIVIVWSLNEIVEAMMPLNMYDDFTVSLQWLHVKRDLDIVQAS